MRPGDHIEAFEERKETIFKWAVEVRGIEKSQRIIGDNASKAMIELLSAYLHKKQKIDEGFQINHTWFKSEKVFSRLPEFQSKETIVSKMIDLEKLCEKLSYGTPRAGEEVRKALSLFEGLETLIKGMI